MIKAMFFDVDGTLVSFRTHRTTAAMADALEQLHRRGIKLFISTGRHPRMLQYLRDLFPFDGWVTMSGQFCYCGDQVIHRNPMGPPGGGGAGVRCGQQRLLLHLSGGS